jgi:hypothetical protein
MGNFPVRSYQIAPSTHEVFEVDEIPPNAKLVFSNHRYEIYSTRVGNERFTIGGAPEMLNGEHYVKCKERVEQETFRRRIQFLDEESRLRMINSSAIMGGSYGR